MLKSVLPPVSLALLCLGCGSPTSSAAQISAVQIFSLTPTAGPVNTNVVILGQGFTVSGNTVVFSSNTPPSPDIVPNLSSDGSTLKFVVPSQWTPECVYTTRCPIPFIPRMPGDYTVTVTNVNGTSNPLIFRITSTPIP